MDQRGSLSLGPVKNLENYGGGKAAPLQILQNTPQLPGGSLVEGEAGELPREQGLDNRRFGMVSDDLRKHLLDDLNGNAAPQQLKPKASAIPFAITYR